MSNAATKSVALWVVRVLRKAGFEALFAGGCVRDMLLGVRCTDYDVATSATPEQVRKLFRHVLLVGAKFGVAMVIVDRRRVEVTTFRSEESYSDGRRPDHVTFTTARQDALRRDFTINGMFFDPIANEVIDYVGGREDLRRGVIRTIGSPELRFGEDYLRLIRAVRFAVRLGFEIDPATADAVRHHAPKVTGISGERVFDELSKMLAKPSAAAALAMLEELELARHILPELSGEPRPEGSGPSISKQKQAEEEQPEPLTSGRGSPEAELLHRAIARVAAVAARKDLTLTLAAFLCELDVATIAALIRRWGASNELRDGLVFLAGHLGDLPRSEAFSLADLKRLMANRNFKRLLALWRVEESLRTGKTCLTAALSRRAGKIDPSKVAPPPLLTGMDLKGIGLKEGPTLGGLLRAIYDAQLNEQIATRKQAFALAARIVESGA
jgi:poly(A) polymerase